jgi:pimeloyl-ACP methyl ester carboxylesterase
MFRGTYADGTSDWKRNLQFNQLKVPLPDALGDSQEDTTIYFHRGCFEYLFRNSDRDPSYPKERYEEILNNILDCLKLYPDYKVFISGHSLGGALALLVAFYASADVRLPKPVTCVSVGSLLIGDEHFGRAFQRLEALGWIRHLRITNDNDPVPYLPPFSWYRPVGMHLRLFQKGGYSLSHAAATRNESPENSTWRFLWQAVRESPSVAEFLEPHYVSEYLRRLEKEKQSLTGMTLNDCYRDPKFVGDFKTRL